MRSLSTSSGMNDDGVDGGGDFVGGLVDSHRSIIGDAVVCIGVPFTRPDRRWSRCLDLQFFIIDCRYCAA